MRQTGRVAGWAGAVVGFLVAGAAAGVAAERYAISRLRLRPDPEAREAFGLLPAARTGTVLTEDGIALHVEESGDLDAPLTLVFVHGYCLSMGTWHYQRRELSGPAPAVGRLVFYDSRGHGLSGVGDRGSATIDQLGHDLRTVIDEVAPTGPLVLVGHSMGGMTILALAAAAPELFAERVVAVGLLSASTGRLTELTFGLPATVGRAVRRLTPRPFAVLRRRSAAVGWARGAGTDLAFGLTKRFSFGDSPGNVSPTVVDFVEATMSATPVDVVADFYAALVGHDKRDALPVLRRVETLLLTGAADRMIPAGHSVAMAEELPDAELVVLPGAGHVVMMERPSLVTFHLRALVARAQDRSRGSA